MSAANGLIAVNVAKYKNIYLKFFILSKIYTFYFITGN